MRIVIISDIHANLEALAVLPQDYDQLWVLGDVVNYGPDPTKVVEFVRSRAKHVVRGNHDQFIGYGEDPRCIPHFREMADATGKFTESQLSAGDKEYLCDLPLQLQLQVGKTRFWLCHAVPSDPLYGYCPPESERWIEECRRVSADILLIGHTHMQFVKKFGDCLVVNPGSLGQPINGSALACFAVWDNGSITLQSTAYAVENTVQKIKTMPVPAATQHDLISILLTGCVPEEWKEGADVANPKN